MKLILELVADQDSHYSRVTLVLIECDGSIRTECAQGIVRHTEADRLAGTALALGMDVLRKKEGA